MEIGEAFLNTLNWLASYYPLIAVIGTIAAIVVILNAAIMLNTAMGNPETITKAKEHIIGAIVGLILLLTGGFLLKALGFTTPIEPTAPPVPQVISPPGGGGGGAKTSFDPTSYAIKVAGSLPIGSAEFDRSKLSKYEAKTSYEDPSKAADAGVDNAINSRTYAINKLGIPESMIKIFPKSEVENMIRSAVETQWNQVTNKHGASAADAKRAILSYQEHESSAFQLFNNTATGLRPSVTRAGNAAALDIMSLTNDKFNSAGYNKRIAAYWDIKYAIYLGVKENIDAFQNSVSGEGAQRWKNAIGYVFLPGNPNQYWSDSRAGVANSAWNHYANETTSSSGGQSTNSFCVYASPGFKIADDQNWPKVSVTGAVENGDRAISYAKELTAKGQDAYAGAGLQYLASNPQYGSSGAFEKGFTGLSGLNQQVLVKPGMCNPSAAAKAAIAQTASVTAPSSVSNDQPITTPTTPPSSDRPLSPL